MTRKKPTIFWMRVKIQFVKFFRLFFFYFPFIHVYSIYRTAMNKKAHCTNQTTNNRSPISWQQSISSFYFHFLFIRLHIGIDFEEYSFIFSIRRLFCQFSADAQFNSIYSLFTFVCPQALPLNYYLFGFYSTSSFTLRLFTIENWVRLTKQQNDMKLNFCLCLVKWIQLFEMITFMSMWLSRRCPLKRDKTKKNFFFLFFLFEILLTANKIHRHTITPSTLIPERW